MCSSVCIYIYILYTHTHTHTHIYMYSYTNTLRISTYKIYASLCLKPVFGQQQFDKIIETCFSKFVEICGHIYV
jgi:hypothetical protein